MDVGFSGPHRWKSNNLYDQRSIQPRPMVLMIPIILKVHADNNCVTEVPITPETTCRDVIDCCKEPGEDHSHLVELWRGCERSVAEDEKPLELLKEWGIHWDEVKFFLRYQSPGRLRHTNGGDRTNTKNGMRQSGTSSNKLPDGVELTLNELQDMAARQQQQIENQQQMLVAKEQRLKFLKQQELRHHQVASENERLRRLRERVEAQELKLRKLRAQRGQVDQQKTNNSGLTSELESIRALFNEKEKELSLAVAKVDELTRQLEELRRGRLSNNGIGNANSPATAELEKLRRELVYRNKLNEAQSAQLAQQREALSRGQEEMQRVDRRINEIQQRLLRKRQLNQQLANQINAAASAKQASQNVAASHAAGRARPRPLSANIAAVEPFKHMPREAPPPPASSPVTSTTKSSVVSSATMISATQDDLHPKLSASKGNDELPEFQASKADPKYQTLPVNTRFTAKFNKSTDEISNEENNEAQAVTISTSTTTTTTTTAHAVVHSIPAYTAPKELATPLAQQQQQQQQISANANAQGKLSNLAPKPYGSTTSSSFIPTRLNSTVTTAVIPKYVPPPVPVGAVAFRGTTNLPNTPLTVASAAQKPVSSVPPTTHHPSPKLGPPNTLATPSRPSPIYQTSSTRIAPITPHTLSATPQGILKEVEDVATTMPATAVTSTIISMATKFTTPTSPQMVVANEPNACGDGNSIAQKNAVMSQGGVTELGSDVEIRDSQLKPFLPPKPCVPVKPTPPPRQSNVERGKVDTSPDAVDSALNILRGNPVKVTNSYRYATRNLIADAYAQKNNSGMGNHFLRSVSASHLRSDGESNASQDSSTEGTTQLTSSDDGDTGKKVTQNELPIKPKPLTIKKHSGVDPPKLKVLNASSASVTGYPRKQSPPLDTSTVTTTTATVTTTTTTSTISDQHNNNNSVVNNNINNNNNNNNAGTARGLPNVHVSINRRIEMPPAFLFPENEAPPADLNASALESNIFSSSSPSLPGSDGVKTDIPDNPVSKVVVTSSVIPSPSYVSPPGSDKTKDVNKSRVTTDVGPKDHVSGDGNNVTVIQIVDAENKNESGGKEIQTATDVNEGNEKNNKKTDFLHVNIADTTELVDEGLSSASSPEGSSDSQPITISRLSPSKTYKGNLKSKEKTRVVRRVSFDPLALLLDASLEGELELVKKTAREVQNPSAANDEGITALHNAICAGHYEIIKFLVEFGCDVNAQDSDGWTPLHCAASCNNLPMVKFLVEHGACIFATTLSDHETAAEKCEEDEEGFDGCSEYLYSIQEKLGILNNGAVYALYDYEAQNADELCLKDSDMIVVLRKGDEFEREWWWSRLKNREGYIPRNLLGLYPRVVPSKDQ